MKISAIQPIKNNQIFRANKNRNSEPCIIDSIYQNEKAIKKGLVGLAVIGAAAVGYNSIRNSGKSPVKFIKNNFYKVKDFLSEKPKSDPIIKNIGKKRDKEALNLYKGLVAKKKMDSLHNKLLSGHFDGKPKEVFESLRKNEVKLRREANLVL